VYALALALACAACSAAQPKPKRAQSPVVRATQGEIRTLPERPAARATAVRELSAMLIDLYSRGFLPPIGVRGSMTPRPTPRSRAPLADVFTDEAGASLEAHRDAFSPGAGVTVATGTIGWSGIVTADGDSPTSALVTVDFTATGRSDEARGVRVRQTGQLYCVRTQSGWRVAGFDVRLSAERLSAPAPGASPR
jgi:hypothetical protein